MTSNKAELNLATGSFHSRHLSVGYFQREGKTFWPIRLVCEQLSIDWQRESEKARSSNHPVSSPWSSTYDCKPIEVQRFMHALSRAISICGYRHWMRTVCRLLHGKVCKRSRGTRNERTEQPGKAHPQSFCIW